LRITDVREAVLLAAMQRTDHFGVEDLVGDLARDGVRASTATVSRVMPLLLEAGIVEHAEIARERSVYETTFGRAHHDHLICQRCHKVVEFQFEAFAMLEREVAAKYDFELRSHVHELSGLCGECRRAPAGKPTE
jgi:Fur family ferric uptake transcriptional regulator